MSLCCLPLASVLTSEQMPTFTQVEKLQNQST